MSTRDGRRFCCNLTRALAALGYAAGPTGLSPPPPHVAQSTAAPCSCTVHSPQRWVSRMIAEPCNPMLALTPPDEVSR